MEKPRNYDREIYIPYDLILDIPDGKMGRILIGGVTTLELTKQQVVKLKRNILQRDLDACKKQLEAKEKELAASNDLRSHLELAINEKLELRDSLEHQTEENEHLGSMYAKLSEENIKLRKQLDEYRVKEYESNVRIHNLEMKLEEIQKGLVAEHHEERTITYASENPSNPVTNETILKSKAFLDEQLSARSSPTTTVSNNQVGPEPSSTLTNYKLTKCDEYFLGHASATEFDIFHTEWQKNNPGTKYPYLNAMDVAEAYDNRSLAYWIQTKYLTY